MDSSDESSDLSEISDEVDEYIVKEDLLDNDDDCLYKAREYIEHVSGRFEYRHRSTIKINRVHPRIWKFVMEILRSNFYRLEYLLTLCRFCDVYAQCDSDERKKDLISLFRIPDSELIVMEGLASVERIDIYSTKLRPAYDEDDDAEIDKYIHTCRDLAVRNMYKYINFVPFVSDVGRYLWAYMDAGFIGLVKTLTKNKNVSQQKIEKNIKKITIYAEFRIFAYMGGWYGLYTKIKLLLANADMWDLYGKYLPVPYLYAVSHVLSEIGFPGHAVLYIHEYLHRTWFKQYVFRHSEF